METWWNVPKHPYFGKEFIQPVQVVKVTEKMIEIFTPADQWSRARNRRQAKVSDYDRYFPTWYEAYKFLVERQTAKVESLKSQLSAAQETLALTHVMLEP